MAVGVSADWGIICNWFLRLFDVTYHDIAQSRVQIDCMVETLDAVFQEGRVFQSLLPRAAPGAGAATQAASGAAASDDSLPCVGAHGGDHKAGFITTTVMKNLGRKYLFLANGNPVLHWGEPLGAHKKELLERVQNAAYLTKGRLRADFPEGDIRWALSMFDRRLVRKGFGDLPCLETHRSILRGVREVAKALGVDETAAVRQYRDVLPFMLDQFSAGKPLAEKTNQDAWARLLDDAFWELACPKRFRNASGALRKIIRFYISIEDGECAVERDFSVLRDELREHRTSDVDFLDDVLVAKLSGPRTVAEFDDSASATRGELTPFSRKCACLWRQIYGARFGHYNPAATRAATLKRADSRGPLRRASLGVLAAARLAVVSKRRNRSSAVAAVHAGAGTDRSIHWNDASQKFQDRTAHNITGVTQVRAAPGGAFLKPPGVNLAASRGACLAPKGPSPHTQVAVLAASGAMGDLRLRCSREVKGPHRCFFATLVVVRDLAVLHDAATLAADADMAVSFLYIVALGLDVVASAQLEAVQYAPGKLLPSHCLRHKRACCEGKATLFFVEERLDVECPSVRSALRRIQRVKGSKIVVGDAGDEPASGGVSFRTLLDVVNWALSVRKTANELGPKVLSVDGARCGT